MRSNRSLLLRLLLGSLSSASALMAGDTGSNLHWLAPSVGSVNQLGTLTLATNDHGAVNLLSPAITGNGGPLKCKETRWNPDGTELTIGYAMGNETVQVMLGVRATHPGDGSGTGIEVQMDADQPVIASVNIGNWANNLNTQAISVPYYTGNVWYTRNFSAYLNAWWDWHTTQATLINKMAAQYNQKTDGTLNKLHEQMEVVVSANLDEVLPEPGNTASPYVSELAGRMVLDIWDAGFSGIEEGLSNLGDYGITNCVVILHDWQREGYDNALPEHYPANPDLGGDAGLRRVADQAKANGCLMALHENYVDYYPNYPKFDPAAVALNSDGSRTKAWFREERIPPKAANADTSMTSGYALPRGWNPLEAKPGWIGIQSFSTKSGWMVTNAMTQSPVIHEVYGTTADYLDVNSAAPISSHGDMDANSPGAGTLAAWMNGNKTLWAYERQTHGGPVFGEGGDHWNYSGLLDGVEAQASAGGVALNSGETLPLFADFDLLRVHPLQVNHGMGYYERWTRSKTNSMTRTQMDSYRMQEIAFGHAPFLGSGSWSDISRAFVESNLVTPVAESYGIAQVNSIEYQVNGAWVSSSLAAIPGQFAQVRVAYNNGLTVVANAGATTLNWNNLNVPQYGWAAKSDRLLAYTALCDSAVCDYAQTPTSVFANARSPSDTASGAGYAAPSVVSVETGNGKSFVITYRWQVYRALKTPSLYRVFVHFVDDRQASVANDGIIFQGDHRLASSQWRPGQTIVDGPLTVRIPSSVPDGTYSIRVGLYDSTNGKRLELSGKSDGTIRYTVGFLTLSGGGAQISFVPPISSQIGVANTVVNFSTVQTDGMISIKLENGMWVLRPYPRYRNFTVLLKAADFPTPAIVQTTGDLQSTVSPVAKCDYWQLPLNGSKAYSWLATNSKLRIAGTETRTTFEGAP